MNTRNLFLIFSLLIVQLTQSQDIVYFEDFETGTSDWILTGTWDVTGNAYQGLWCLNESPSGNYANQTSMTATMVNGIDLSTANESLLEFTAKHQIEYGFDFLYVEASPGGGVNWIPVATFTGDSLSWAKYTFSLGGFVGNADVRIRFRFTSDDLLNFDGMRFDNVVVYVSTIDQTPPLIFHTPLPHYEGHLNQHPVQAYVTDISGVDSVWLEYLVDNVAQNLIPALPLYGNQYLFTIPAQAPGAYVSYRFHSVDSALTPNTGQSPWYFYTAGNYISYDDGQVDFIQPIGASSVSSYTGAALKVTLGGTTNLVTALIRNYTDPNSINSQMQFHVWADSSGYPAGDLITPFMISPAANAASPSQITRIDLRPYASSLSAISGNVFIGFTVPLGSVWVTQTTPAVANRTKLKLSNIWFDSQDDFHFRAITSAVAGAPAANFSFSTSTDPNILFTDLSTGSPTTWLWNFGDGTTSNQPNPTHIYSSNGTFNVSLTISNTTGSTTVFQLVTVNGCVIPTANFEVYGSLSPTLIFNQTSLGYPTSFSWNFGDGSPLASGNQVEHLFSTNGVFQVCLIASNSLGADTFCMPVGISDYVPPIAAFGYNSVTPPNYGFVDMTSSDLTNSASSWHWDFGDGTTSTQQNPVHVYSANGIYHVCLIATNSIGSDTACLDVVVDYYQLPQAGFAFQFVALNLPGVQFTDLSNDSLYVAPTLWFWDFGDGTTSALQNPLHTFQQNGIFEVCLIVTNSVSSDTLCQNIEINCYAIPQADFSFTLSGDPEVQFSDLSAGVPTEWLWVFEPNGAADVVQNPLYTFTTNGTFSVCLTVGNYLGDSQLCHDVVISGYAVPQSAFSFAITADKTLAFDDNSNNNPTIWSWSFGDGQTSSEQNPVHEFSDYGDYLVCLTASNQFGAGIQFCQMIQVILSLDGISTLSQTDVFPNPASDEIYMLVNGHAEQPELVSVLGQSFLPPVISQDKNRIRLNVSGLPSGIYYIKNQNNAEKIVIRH